MRLTTVAEFDTPNAQNRAEAVEHVEAVYERIHNVRLDDGSKVQLAHVVIWSEDYGTCYDCGKPAAFALPDAYGENPDNVIEDTHKRCAICAANGAADGNGRVIRLAAVVA
jgi:hypothetical protein